MLSWATLDDEIGLPKGPGHLEECNDEELSALR